MLSVSIHKDFTEYEPKVVAGLSMRTVICLGGAAGCAAAIGIVCVGMLGLSLDSVTWAIWICAVPFFCIGFLRPYGLTFEKIAPLIARHYLAPQRILYKTPLHRGAEGKEREEARAHQKKTRPHDKDYDRLRKLQGIETISFGDL